MPLSLVGEDSAGAFYARQAGSTGGRVLVLGAADGQVACAVAAQGTQVLAVEPSDRLLTLARARWDEEPGREGLTLLAGDPRTWRSDERFGLVLAPQNALGLMASPQEVDAFFGTIAAHLSPGGAFTFDVRAEVADELDDRPALTGREFMPHLRERTRGRAPSQGLRRFTRRRFRPDAIDLALRGVGLEARERYGDFAGTPFDDRDELQVVLGGRA